MNKKIIYCDMDEVIVDFHSHPTMTVSRDSYNDTQIFEKGYFRDLKPIPYALDAVKALMKDPRLDVYILTHGLAKSEFCFQEKLEWIREYLPELVEKTIITCDKTLHKGDILIDDSFKWNKFEGTFIHFNKSYLLQDDNLFNTLPDEYDLMWREVLTMVYQEVQ